MNKTTFLAAFKCSKCKSFIKQKLLTKHKEIFKKKVMNKTIKCYACK